VSIEAWAAAVFRSKHWWHIPRSRDVDRDEPCRLQSVRLKPRVGGIVREKQDVREFFISWYWCVANEHNDQFLRSLAHRLLSVRLSQPSFDSLSRLKTSHSSKSLSVAFRLSHSSKSLSDGFSPFRGAISSDAPDPLFGLRPLLKRLSLPHPWVVRGTT
jgi:hypothetical protein